MRNLKKVLGLVLCLAMMLSIMVVGAGAAFADQDQIDTKHQEAVDMCNALNIITGFENGKFMPNDNVTREQMAKMICVLDNGGKEPQLSAGNTFTDVPADRWSNKYIEACASRGVVVGVGGGKFAPAGKVTATQAAKMLLVELGYDDDEQQYSGPNWATKVNVDATAKGYYENLEDIDVNAPLSREHAAQMVWNALQQAEIAYTYSANGAKVLPVDKTRTINGTEVDWTLIRDKYGVVITEGTLGMFEFNSKDQDWTYSILGDRVNTTAGSTVDGYIRADGQLYTSLDAANSTTDYTDLLGQNVKMVWKYDSSANKDVVMGIFPKDSTVLFDGVIGNLPSMANTDTDLKFDGTKYKFESNYNVATVPVFYFQGNAWYTVDDTTLGAIAGKNAANKNIVSYDAYDFQAIDKDGNGKIDFLMVYPYAVAEVTYNNGTDIKLSDVRNDGVQALVRDNIIASTEFGKKVALEDVSAYDGIDEDDYVVFVPAKNTAKDTATLTKIDLVAGKISVKDGDDVTIDGTVYTKDASFTVANVNAGSNLKDIVSHNNYIFKADVSANFDVTDYVVVIGSETGAYGSTAKLLFSDGSKKVVDLDTDVTVAEKKKDGTNTTEPRNGCRAITGNLYTYDTNKDGEYQLTPATDKNTGFDYALAHGTKANHENGVTGTVDVQKLKNTTPEKAGYINGYAIADDAVIFVQYNSGNSYKAITGAAMKTMNLAQFSGANAGNYVLATKNSSSGVGAVNLAYVTSSYNKVQSNDSQYGYILKVVEAQNEDNQAIYQVTMMTKDAPTGTTIETVKTASLNADTKAALTAGMDNGVAVEYTLDTDGKLDEITQAYSALNSVLTGKGPGAVWISNSRTELDDNAVILVVDASEPEAIEVGSVDSIKVAKDNNGDGNLDNNAYVIREILSSNGSSTTYGDIMLIVYDSDNGDTSAPVAPVAPATVAVTNGTASYTNDARYNFTCTPTKSVYATTETITVKADCIMISDNSAQTIGSGSYTMTLVDANGAVKATSAPATADGTAKTINFTFAATNLGGLSLKPGAVTKASAN